MLEIPSSGANGNQSSNPPVLPRCIGICFGAVVLIGVFLSIYFLIRKIFSNRIQKHSDQEGLSRDKDPDRQPIDSKEITQTTHKSTPLIELIGAGSFGNVFRVSLIIKGYTF